MELRKATTGRPPSRIDGERLKGLRKDAGLTQTEFARAVYGRAGRPVPDDATLKTAAQRWEAKGAIHAQLLEPVACILGTSVGVLRGESPEPAPSISEHLAICIRQQMEKGAPAALAAALERFGSEDPPERALAASLATRLEAAQLTGDEQDLRYLSELTGLTPSELRKPVSERGHWVFISAGMPGEQRHEILLGIDEVRYEARKEMALFFENTSESDIRVRFMRDRHWFRISLEHSRVASRNRYLQFSRCQADEKGLRWCKATWNDQFFIDWLVEETRTQANFVVGFDGTSEPQDLRNLRLVVMRSRQTSSRQQTIETLQGNSGGFDSNEPPVLVRPLVLDNFHSKQLESFCKEGIGHDAATNWLTTDVWEGLFPFLAPWPLEYWQLRNSGASLSLHLNLPLAALREAIRGGFDPVYGPSFQIALYEALPDGTLKLAPWASRSVEKARARLEGLKSYCIEPYEQFRAGHPPAT